MKALANNTNDTTFSPIKMQLLSTLNNKMFFSILVQSLNNEIKGKVDIYLYKNNMLKFQLFKDNKLFISKNVDNVDKVLSVTSKNKAYYFSNNTTKDSLFNNSKTKFLKQLVIPIEIDGLLLSIINIKRTQKQKDFSNNDILILKELLNEIKPACKNLLIFNQAVSLSRALNIVSIENYENTTSSNNDSYSTSKQKEDTSKVMERTKKNNTQLHISLKSKSIQKIKILADKLANSNFSFAIEGEHGAGKEFWCQYIVKQNNNKESVFIYDASTIDPLLSDIMLFGVRNSDDDSSFREGLLKKADKGVLIIKNMTLLPSEVQNKLAGIISDKYFVRQGESDFIPCQTRIVMISKEPLSKLHSEQKITKKLFFSLGNIILQIPSLRDRTDDIEALATYFLNKGHSIDEYKFFAPSVIEKLKEYKWPGNISELASAMERAYVLTSGNVVTEATSFDKEIVENIKRQDELIEIEQFTEESLADIEKKHIIKALKYLSGNKCRTAKMLGITVKTLYNKIHSYSI